VTKHETETVRRLQRSHLSVFPAPCREKKAKMTERIFRKSHADGTDRIQAQGSHALISNSESRRCDPTRSLSLGKVGVTMTCRTRTSIMPPGAFIRHLRKARCGGVLAFRAILSVRLIMNVHREPVMTRKATEQLQPKCVTERSGDKGAHEHARVKL
jgi:hypothetical protein